MITPAKTKSRIVKVATSDEDKQKSDEVIDVTLSRSDYATLRDMIEKQKSLSFIGKYIRNVVFVAAGGVLGLLAFGDSIKKLLTQWLGG